MFDFCIELDKNFSVKTLLLHLLELLQKVDYNMYLQHTFLWGNIKNVKFAFLLQTSYKTMAS